MNSQYNEEEIIINFFQSKRDGFLVAIVTGKVGIEPTLAKLTAWCFTLKLLPN